MGARALMFDFNGTLSDDEPLLFAILADLFAEQGRPLPEDVYYEQLAGLSDPEIVRLWLGEDNPAVEDVLAERIARYAPASPTARPSRRPPARPCSTPPSASRWRSCRARTAPEITPALQAAGLGSAITVLVAIEDVDRGKPDPAGYLLALELLGGGICAGPGHRLRGHGGGRGLRQGGGNALRGDPGNAYAGAARPGGRARSGA